MIGARNILIHAYESLKPQIIQGMVDTDIPALLAAVQRVVGEAGH